MIFFFLFSTVSFDVLTPSHVKCISFKSILQRAKLKLLALIYVFDKDWNMCEKGFYYFLFKIWQFFLNENRSIVKKISFTELENTEKYENCLGWLWDGYYLFPNKTLTQKKSNLVQLEKRQGWMKDSALLF